MLISHIFRGQVPLLALNVIFTPRLSDVQVPPQERLNGGGGEGVGSATGTSGQGGVSLAWWVGGYFSWCSSEQIFNG